MKAKLLSVAVALVALATASPALADAGSGGSGGFQAGAQNASTNQGAVGIAASNQNAVNANVPVSIAGGNVTAGPSTATQNATSNATADVSNKAKTDQDQYLTQNVGPSGCYAGCGGSGGFQAGVQNAQTNQLAVGAAISKQNAVNANVPVSIAGGNVSSGPSTATQNATSNATTDVSNRAKTDQDQHMRQNIDSGCGCDPKGSGRSNGSSAGSGGDGGFQAGVQNAETNQGALGAAVSKQNAVNANVPVSIAGGNVTSGPSTATQNATSTATTDVSNKAKTDQDQSLKQNIGSGCGCDSKGSYDPKGSSDHSSGCVAGCGGAGGFQLGVQNAETNQFAAGLSKSDQNAVNANVPVSIAGGNVSSGPSTATQNATSTATTDVSNKAKTDQDQHLTQNIGGGSCLAGCGGAGGFQLGVQKADTNQWAAGAAFSNQNAVNSNTPASTAGGNISSGPSTATQNATSNATTDVSNKAKTDQNQWLTQNVGSGCGCDSKDSRSSSGPSGCIAGCGGAGGFQVGLQNAETNQWAAGLSKSDQNAVNGNSPASTAGGNISSGPSTATQNATSNATTDVSNKAKTNQDQGLTQNIGGGSCLFGCGGPGGFQAGIQNAETKQGALGIAYSDQNAVNGNSPASTAGGNIYAGPSTATQNATSNATTDVSNRAKTDQNQYLTQNVGSGCGCDSKGSYDPKGYGSSSDHNRGCVAGCGGAGGFQVGLQNAQTNQWAAGIALSDQNAVNGNSPASTAGGNITSGPSTATQNATSNATADVSNKAKTNQDQHLRQDIGGGSCLAGCGGPGGFQLGLQNAETNQWAAGIALSYQNAVNGNSPSSTAGGNIASGPSTATQNASSTGYTDTSNRAKTDQDQGQNQSIGKSCGEKCGPTGIRSEAPTAGGASYDGSQLGSQGSNSGDLAKSDHNREQQPIRQS